MKKNFISFSLVIIISSQVAFAQWSNDPAPQVYTRNLCENGTFGPVDDSFNVYPDTLFFLLPEEIWEGKMFHIINPHDYSLDIQYIQQQGTYPPQFIPWYTEPWNMTFPVTIAAGDSFGVTVKWPVLDDFGSLNLIYDTLHINTINSAGHVIIVVDSTWIIMGINETGKWNFSAFPNPFIESLNISLNMDEETDAEVTIFNTLMQPVRTLHDGRLHKGSNQLTWDGIDANHNRVAPGVYLISVRTATGSQTFRIIRL